MQSGHEGRGRQTGTFLARPGRNKQRPGHRTGIATYDRKTTTTPGARRPSCMGNHWLQRGRPIDEHTYRRATATTTREAHCYGNRATSRLQTNYLPTPKTHQNSRTGGGGSTTDPTANKPTIRQLAPPGINSTATETATSSQTDHTKTGQHKASWSCKGQNKNGVPRAGDTKVRQARRRPQPRKK